MPTRFPVKDPATGSLREVEFYSFDEAAAVLGLHRRTLTKAAAEGRLPHVTVLGRRFVTLPDIAGVVQPHNSPTLFEDTASAPVLDADAVELADAATGNGPTDTPTENTAEDAADVLAEGSR